VRIRAAVITVSDKGYAGEGEDISGPRFEVRPSGGTTGTTNDGTEAVSSRENGGGVT